jgi:hypothetical protein
MDAPMVHVPASTNVIAPVDESTVHTEVVELVYVLVSPLSFAVVAVAVGFVPTSNAYEALNALRLKVRSSLLDVVNESVGPLRSTVWSGFSA